MDNVGGADGGVPPIMGAFAPATGFITGSLINLGTVDYIGAATPSTLSVGGNYSQVDTEEEPSATPGVLDMRIGNTIGNDVLFVMGVASLSGTLNVTVFPGDVAGGTGVIWRLIAGSNLFALDPFGNAYDFLNANVPGETTYLGLGVVQGAPPAPPGAPAP